MEIPKPTTPTPTHQARYLQVCRTLDYVLLFFPLVFLCFLLLFCFVLLCFQWFCVHRHHDIKIAFVGPSGSLPALVVHNTSIAETCIPFHWKDWLCQPRAIVVWCGHQSRATVRSRVACGQNVWSPVFHCFVECPWFHILRATLVPYVGGCWWSKVQLVSMLSGC